VGTPHACSLLFDRGDKLLFHGRLRALTLLISVDPKVAVRNKVDSFHNTLTDKVEIPEPLPSSATRKNARQKAQAIENKAGFFMGVSLAGS
jgi:hypothetical protein